MLAQGILLGAGRALRRSPAVWILGAALLGACPLTLALGPFPPAGIDPLRVLLWTWSVPAGVLAGGLGLLTLARHADFLEQVGTRTRWGGELLTLTTAPLVGQLLLLGGALLVAPERRPFDHLALAAWARACILLDLHLAGVGMLLLRSRARAWILGALWWGGLLLAPELLATEHTPRFLDIGLPLRELGTGPDAPGHTGSLVLLLGLFALSALAPRRTPRPGRGSAGSP